MIAIKFIRICAHNIRVKWVDIFKFNIKLKNGFVGRSLSKLRKFLGKSL